VEQPCIILREFYGFSLNDNTGETKAGIIILLWYRWIFRVRPDSSWLKRAIRSKEDTC
jgi:hypothetical protein